MKEVKQHRLPGRAGRAGIALALAVTSVTLFLNPSTSSATFHTGCQTGSQGCARFLIDENPSLPLVEYGYTNLPGFPGGTHNIRMDGKIARSGNLRNRGIVGGHFVASGGQHLGGTCVARKWDSQTWVGASNRFRWVAKSVAAPAGCTAF